MVSSLNFLEILQHVYLLCLNTLVFGVEDARVYYVINQPFRSKKMDRTTTLTSLHVYWQRCISVALHRCNARVITRKLSNLAQCNSCNFDSYSFQLFTR